MNENKINHAEQDLSELTDNDLGQASGGNVADRFKGLPIQEFISGPLEAAAQAQQELAKLTKEFCDKCGFKVENE